jgi:cation diffusion facilitator CzcD-associated flavoprotein CzcO
VKAESLPEGIEVSSTKIDDDSEIQKEVFDYLMVCNGHFTVPNVP